MLEADLVVAGNAPQSFAILQGNAQLVRLPGHRAKHCAGIQAGKAQLLGHGLGYRGLACAAGAVDCDDHDARLLLSSKNVG